MRSYEIIDIGEIVQEAAGPQRSEEVLEKILWQLGNARLDPGRIAKITMQFNTSTEYVTTMREQRILWQGMVKYVGFDNIKAFPLLYFEDEHFADRLNVSIQLWELITECANAEPT